MQSIENNTSPSPVTNLINGRLFTLPPIQIIKPTSIQTQLSNETTQNTSQPVTPTGTLSNPITSLTSEQGNLSPSVVLNISLFKNILTSIQPASTTSSTQTNPATTATSTTTTTNSNSSLTPVVDSNQATSKSNDTSKQIEKLNENDKKFQKLGKFIFFEPQLSTDTFSSAYDIQKNCFFYWKKFSKRDYMKKLEPYVIMENSEFIYKFSELVMSSMLQPSSNSSSSSLSNKTNNFVNDENEFAYALFEPHYGDLHSYMKEKKKLAEPEAKHIFKQCVKAVYDCHMNGIIVRDIKLKKFVFIDSERTKIALANLEDCLILEQDAKDDFIRSQQGCPAYVSPEVLNPQQKSYSGKLSDSWSLGIILYTLLIGRYPFHHQTITTMFAKIARAKFQIPPTSVLSLDAKILLRSLIRLKPDERLIPSEILAHNWLRDTDIDFKLKQQSLFNLNEAKYSSFVNNSSSLFNSNLILNQQRQILINNNNNNNNPFINSNNKRTSSAINTTNNNNTLSSLNSNLNNQNKHQSAKRFRQETEEQTVPEFKN